MTAPETAAVRWRPSRAGILNVWRYYDEVFEFHNGRLLLRGPNGTGKSKALELLLPFLFDADLRANRLSTFGSAERTMHWNLMGEGASGVTRVGYAWLEFRCGDGWFTCGARLQASKHTAEVRADFFTTSRRVGVDLRLVNGNDQPLTRTALEERLGELGTVHDTPAEHRAAVRAALFPELTEPRYEALITALLQLRTPKLSERLDPNLLSTLLSRALPPLGAAEISELAEGFERLDRRREHLARLDEQVRAADAVADRQSGYARRVLRAAAADLLAADADLDRAAEEAADGARRHERTAADRDEVLARRGELAREADRLRARIAGLADGHHEAAELDRLHAETTEAERTATAARDRADRRATEADAAAQRAAAAAARAAAVAELAVRAERDARGHAEPVGLAGAFQEAAGTADRRRARLLLRAAARGEHDRTAEVRAAADRHDRAVAARTAAEQHLEEARGEQTAAAERSAEAARAHADRLDAQAQRVRDWAAGLVELPVDDLDAAARAGTRAALLALLHPGYLTAAAELGRAHAAATARRDECRALHAELTARRDRAEDPAEDPQRPGAPLWRLVAFRSGTTPGVQAKVEAALHSAGLLDAWVGPDGVLDGEGTRLDPARLRPVDGTSLVEVLRPESGGPVDRDRIWAVLHGIGYGAASVDPAEDPAGAGRHRSAETAPEAAIAPDGRWRLAGLTGDGSAPEVARIGSTARDRDRKRRDAALDERIEEVAAELAELDTAAGALDARRDALRAEWEAAPDDSAVRDSRRAADVAEAEAAARDGLAHHRAEQVAAAADAARRAGDRLTELAAELGRPADRSALDELDRRVAACTDSAADWLDARFAADAERRAADTAAEVARRSRDVAAERRAEAEEAERDALRRAERADAVRAALGTADRQVLDELAELRAGLHDVELRRDRSTDRLVEVAGRLGALEHRRAADTARHEAARAARDAAAHRLRRHAAAGFAVDAGIELSELDDDGAVLAAAREISGAWEALPHGAKDRADALGKLAEAVHGGRHVLADRAELRLEPGEDAQLFAATLDGVRLGATGLRDALRAERDRLRAGLTGAERELFDQTLTGETRRHLAARIRQAGELVDTMNARLKRVRTASKVAVRLVWEVDPNLPAGTGAARELLLTDPERLDDADKDVLHAFFRERVDEARRHGTAAGWEGQLAQVFDYTSWHRFGVQIDRANGEGWQLLTKRLHGALSGGEKAIALHLPLFAAVAAHYQAVPAAPRFILLDEVFVGVDATNRGQVFDLLTALDLDLVLTSDHEWCTYRELDGIAVHQLITGDGDDAVTTARFVWDGRALAEERGAP
ncbi:TIGR02680 family protein [Saccharopolyspora sp. 6V]|uniref:TIGR02680 family protein n=1 Tax=Saccharopolyspora sp. 6V TaxID=2877239 RepID=UPI001CD1BA09|nr:TIGR02680 family protein [Saccharopolyspora sp. 6V]MCA1191199.1 TIGR02680 family protein [Saccharopolyspora sp. 6V]